MCTFCVSALSEQGRTADHVPITKLDGLAQFLRLRGHTLLIKGEPGSGKTTLAFRIMQDFGEAKSIYISSRVSESKLYTQIYYAERLLSRGEFMDVRLDTLESIIRRVIEVRGENQDVLVVLDTWDGLAKELDDKTRLKTEKALIALADGSNARFIFVSEEPEKTTMDYLVDGIVELLRTEESGRIIREIVFHKLRGTPIEHHRYVFSLAGGKFSYVPPYKEPDYSAAQRPPTVADPNPDTYSFGSVFDELFGGIEKGSTITLEMQENVPSSAVRLVTIPLAINFLNNGRGCLYIPILGANPKQILETIRPRVSDDAAAKRLLIATAPSETSTVQPPFFPLERGSVMDSHAYVHSLVEKLKESSRDGHVLVVDGISLLENMYSTELERLVESLAHRVIVTQRDGDLAVFIVHSRSKLLTQILSMTNKHIKLWMRDGSVLMAGEKPFTPTYAIWPSENQILPEYIKIV